MNAIELIPAIDIIDGKCVRLAQGDYDRITEYSSEPADVAREMEDHGIRRLHVVDLDGAASKHIVNYRTLEKIASATSIVIDFGGGVKSDDDLRIAFDCGASMVTGGSIAVSAPETFESWLSKYGKERIILGADAKDGKIAVNGWKDNSGDDLSDFIGHYVSKGIEKVICTDISKDGMLQGPSIKLYEAILHKHENLYLIASGGVGSAEDIYRLQECGVPAVIFGKALYEGKISWKEIEIILGIR